ncbi:hypothetical protein RIF29_26754 [Crotalaria pallida]|uniref:Uncharacterized protein n=1 Tax=Crotalaria pallida TaxID=3830 RepID=A0AAN9EQB1_CROPI
MQICLLNSNLNLSSHTRPSYLSYELCHRFDVATDGTLAPSSPHHRDPSKQAVGKSKKTKRTTPKSNDIYLKLLVKLAEDLDALPIWVFNNGISHTDEVDTSVISPFVQIYTGASNMFSRANAFDGASRSGPKGSFYLHTLQAFVSEYAVIGNNAGTGSLLAAIAEAGFLIGLEKNRFYEGRVSQGSLRGTPVIFKVYPGKRAADAEADMLAANELNAHSFLQWLAFHDNGKYSAADYAKRASERVSRDRALGESSSWNRFEQEQAIKRRRYFFINLLQGVMRDRSSLHAFP